MTRSLAHITKSSTFALLLRAALFAPRVPEFLRTTLAVKGCNPEVPLKTQYLHFAQELPFWLRILPKSA